jgi:dimethylaniline monooxygenase (N-oxide forming)
MSRWRNGLPADLIVTSFRRRITYFLNKHFPNLTNKLADFALTLVQKKYQDKVDPAWGLGNPASVTLSISLVMEEIIDLLHEGKVTSMAGIKRFIGPRSVEFTDGTVLDDIDAVVCCTGYLADFDLAPFIEMSTPKMDMAGKPYGGPPIARLFMNLFPPAHADSMAVLAYSQFGKNNGFSFSDVTSMAVSNIWRGISSEMVPNRTKLEQAVDKHHAWVASRWQLDHNIDVSMVRQWEFQGFLHKAAGTGMENLGWGPKGWLFWLRDPKMSYLMNHGAETAHAFRFFETGKRRVWPGAREAIIHINKLIKQIPAEE